MHKSLGCTPLYPIMISIDC